MTPNLPIVATINLTQSHVRQAIALFVKQECGAEVDLNKITWRYVSVYEDSTFDGAAIELSLDQVIKA